MSADILRHTYESLIEGDPEPLVSLMSDDMIWRGRKHSWRFWKPAPS
jgi:ketosteroid isomerase-like protein